MVERPLTFSSSDDADLRDGMVQVPTVICNKHDAYDSLITHFNATSPNFVT